MIGYGRLPRPPRSLPGLTRQSIYFARLFRSMMDARVKPGHDELGRGGSMVSSSQHAHDVALLHDQEFFAVELDLGARPFAEQHAVADLEVDRDQFAGFVAATRADGGDFALRGLFLGPVRNDNAASGLLFGIDTLDHNAVVKRTEFHAILLFVILILDWQSQVASANYQYKPVSVTYKASPLRRRP